MATRDRTQLFVQYRDSFRAMHRSSKREEAIEMKELRGKAALLGHDEESGYPDDSSSSAPPQWMTVVDDVRTRTSVVNRMLTDLAKAHSNHLRPKFDLEDDDSVSGEIEHQSAEITKQFRVCEMRIRQLGAGMKPPAQGQHLTQDQTSLASELQSLNTKFRRMQKDYVKKKTGQTQIGEDFEGTDAAMEAENDTGFSEAQMDVVVASEAMSRERLEEIQNIAKSINELAEIFKDLAVLVIDQGTLLDRIDYNCEMTAEYTGEAVEELTKANEYQKKNKLMICILCLSILIGIFSIILLTRAFG